MKRILILSMGFIMILSSCAPKISTSISKRYEPVSPGEDIRVFGLKDAVPPNAEILGTIKIGDTGFSVHCGWDNVIALAKQQARKAGGNAIKITQHIPPSIFGSSCDRIQANILKVDNLDRFPTVDTEDSTLRNANYAVFYIYRPSGPGFLVNYDLHLGDTVLCRVMNNWKTTIKVNKDGMNTLWAHTEAKKEVPVNVKFGKAYYIRCGITMGAFVGHPDIEILDNGTGKAEYESIKPAGEEQHGFNDIIILKNGNEINCRIESEDADNVYFTILRNGKEIKTRSLKKDIDRIEKGK